MRIQAKRILHILGTGLLVLSTLEIASRIDDWLKYDAPLIGNYSFDTSLFTRTQKGLRGIPHGRYLKWQLNGDGFKGPDIDPAGRATRVVLVGASEMFGIYEDADKDIARQTEANLNSAGAPGRFEVINAGIPGMRIGSSVPLLRDLQERYHPAAVFFYPTPTHYIGVTRPYCTRTSANYSQATAQGLELRFLEKAKNLFKTTVPRPVLRLARQVSIYRESASSPVLDSVPDESIKALGFDLQCAIAEARRLGLNVVMATHGNRFGNRYSADFHDDLVGWRMQYPELKEGGFIDLETRANEVIRQVARANAVTLIDIDTALSGRRELFADHAHYNNDGARAFAALLAPALKPQGVPR